MKILFLHGWHSIPGGVKPTYLKAHGHEVINPALDDNDFDAALRTAQAEYNEHRPQVVIGSSRGGAVAMNINSGDAKLVLLCPAWKNWGTVNTVRSDTVILHSRADDVIPFADSEELVRNSGLPASVLVEVGNDHRLADLEPLAAMLDACESGFREFRNRRQDLLNAIRDHFGVELIWHQSLYIGRDDVTVHSFFDPENSTSEMTVEMRTALRNWFASNGWLFSRQVIEHKITANAIERLYLAPMVPVTMTVGYHATRRASLDSIREHGLVPSTSESQTTKGRLDCEGNIYLCERLGTQADEGKQRSFSAHWWRHHLSKVNRFNDPDWVILEVCVDQVEGARLYRDVWSESGVVVENVNRIPWEFINLVVPVAEGK